MEQVLVSNIYPVTNISKNNSKPWELMMDEVEKIGQDVLFDFDGIELEEPWTNTSFRKLMQDSRVHLKIYSSESTKATIDLMCSMGNMPTGRVENEDIMILGSGAPENKEVSFLAERLKHCIEKDKDNVVHIKIYNAVSQLGTRNTIDAIDKVIRDYNKETGDKHFCLELELISIGTSTVRYFVQVTNELENDGFSIEITSEDTDVMNTIKTCCNVIGTEAMSDKDKVKIFLDTIQPNTVGMLSRFKDTKGKDDFGRKGDGKPITCRVAIFRGIEKDDNTYKLVFDQFKGGSFMTPIEYKLEHDGYEHPGLEQSTIKIPIKEIGLCDRFVGELYHFNLPIQYHSDGMTPVCKVNENGGVDTVLMTLPEHVKLVLDSFNVEYNEAPLIYSICETMKCLSNEDDSQLGV